MAAFGHYRSLFSNPRDPQTALEFSKLLDSSSGGEFIGRIGGSDFEAVAQSKTRARHLALAPLSVMGKIANFESRVPYVPPFMRQHLEKVRSLNGYFDVSNRMSNYVKYLDTLDSAYSETLVFTYATRHTQEAIDNGVQNHPSKAYLDSITKNKSLFTYSFIELVDPFVSSMHTWASGKRILFVSPFSRTVEFQLSRRNHLLKLSKFPEFTVKTYSTPVTYSSSFRHREKPKQARTGNWHSEMGLIIEEVLAIDFDVALLSCASYSMPLGVAIKKAGRSAVYIGGALNPMLNIYGERFANPPYSDIVNPRTTVDAFELPDLEKIREGRKHPNEALRAYIRNTIK